MAWPPKRSIRPGWVASTAASASRMWKPGIDRAEPRRTLLPGSDGAKASTGRCSRSFIFEATRPTTPGCQSGSNRHGASGGAPASRWVRDSAASAASVMSCCTLRRCALIRSRVAASSAARCGSSLSRHSMPSAMSSRRPAALIRGPMAKPMSAAVRRASSRPQALISARRPAQPWPARRRRRPAATRARLFASSGTRSATVPTATRSSRLTRSGDWRCSWEVRPWRAAVGSLRSGWSPKSLRRSASSR